MSLNMDEPAGIRLSSSQAFSTLQTMLRQLFRAIRDAVLRPYSQILALQGFLNSQQPTVHYRYFFPAEWS